MRFRPVPSLPAAMLLVALPLAGCAVALGAGAGVATVKALNNQVVREYGTTLDQAYQAAQAALPALGYPPANSTRGPSEASLRSGDVSVGIAEFPGGRVRVAVRVGTFESADSMRRAELIQEQIASQL